MSTNPAVTPPRNIKIDVTCFDGGKFWRIDASVDALGLQHLRELLSEMQAHENARASAPRQQQAEEPQQ